MMQCACTAFLFLAFSHSQLHHLILSFTIITRSLQKCQYFFLVIDTLTPASGSHIFSVFSTMFYYSSFSYSFSHSQVHYHPNIHLNSGFLLHLKSRSTAILEMLQLIEPVFGKTADQKTIMDYHPRNQMEKTIC